MARIRDFHFRYRSSILLPSIRIFVRIFSSAKRWNSRSAGGRPWCKYYPAQARLRKLAKRTHSKWVVYKFDSCIWYLHCHGWFVATTVCVKSKVRLPRVEGRHCGGRGAQWSPTLIMDQWWNWQYTTNLKFVGLSRVGSSPTLAAIELIYLSQCKSKLMKYSREHYRGS